jgi:hypothetical protein
MQPNSLRCQGNMSLQNPFKNRLVVSSVNLLNRFGKLVLTPTSFLVLENTPGSLLDVVRSRSIGYDKTIVSWKWLRCRSIIRLGR